MILIITSKSDGHIGPVTWHLDKAQIPWVRLNTEDAARNIEFNLDLAGGQQELHLRDSGLRVDLGAVRTVWYRKPERVQIDHFDLEGGALDYVEAEFREILDGIYGLLEAVPWINNPFTSRLSHRKMLQLCVASRVGFRIPRTLVSNVPDEVLRFSALLEGDLAIKSLGALSVTETSGASELQYGIFTRRISRQELEAVGDKIAYLPTTFQEFIPKRYELRVTCVGRQVFACRIDSREGDVTADDYRFDTTGLEHSACGCPDLHDRLHAYMDRFGISFACFDIIVPTEGAPVFLEANPNGQWLWVEHLTGLPIAKAVADELIGYWHGGPSPGLRPRVGSLGLELLTEGDRPA